eukprot:snap_masked-scaffold444_size168727-processed-gene-0.7 protein:Tk11365 transcript:snap_masked-scaffold444_size168727-processed-gene-0.7-mRNA-1 annotation:"zinc finger protein with krab and scan domains 8-like isoform x1"
MAQDTPCHSGDRLALFHALRDFATHGIPSPAWPSDVTVGPGTGDVPPVSAHLLVLASASPYLRDILLSCPLDEKWVLILPDFSSLSIQTVLQLLYAGTAPVDMKYNAEILELLNVLEIKCQSLVYFPYIGALPLNVQEPWRVGMPFPTLLPSRNASSTRTLPPTPSDESGLKQSLSISTVLTKCGTSNEKSHPVVSSQAKKKSVRCRERSNLGSEGTNKGSQGNRCQVCSKTFESQWRLKRHCLTHDKTSPGKEYLCQQCGMVFPSYDPYYIHSLRHKPLRDLPTCSLCDKSFATPASLRSHLKGIHAVEGSQKFPCRICGKIFNYKANMMNHEFRHDDIQPFSCQICPKRFRRKDQVEEHLHYHDRNSIDEIIDHFNDFKKNGLNCIFRSTSFQELMLRGMNI